MGKDTSDTPCLSIPTWEALEGWIRDEIEVRIQSIVEEEVTQFLGRGWYERKGAVDAAPGYRNGYGEATPIVDLLWHDKGQAAPCSWVEGALREPDFAPYSLVAPKSWENCSLELYLHGLAQGDFELALRGLLGNGAPLSASSIARLSRRL